MTIEVRVATPDYLAVLRDRARRRATSTRRTSRHSVAGASGTRLVEPAEVAVGCARAQPHCLGVAEDNPAAERLYRRLGYGATGVLDVGEYDRVDDDGMVRHAVERDQLLVKALERSAPRS